MNLQQHSTVLLGALIIIICAVSETNSIALNQKPDINSLLSNPNARRGILNSILQSQGSSIAKIDDIIDAASGNLEQAVNGINSELNEEVLIVGQDKVEINPAAVRNILKNAFKKSIQNKLPNNPDLASALQNSLNEQINTESAQFNAAVALSAIPLDAAQNSLSLTRRKRSLDLGDTISDLITDLITNLISSTLQNLFNDIISNALDSLQDTLNGLLVVTPPSDPVGILLSGVLNFVVKVLLDVITAAQEALPVSAEPSSVQDRRKRDIIGDIGSGVSNIVGDLLPSESSGLLDGIVGPVLTLLGGVLTPINTLVTNLVQQILTALQPILGTIIVTKIGNLATAIIDLVIPTNPA